MAQADPKPARAGECVVVGFDGSFAAQGALRYAAKRAGPTGRVVVVHTPALGAAKDIQASAEQVLPAGVTASFENRDGDPAKAILAEASASGADLIAVGSRGLGRAASLLGSVSQAVIHKADTPVVVVPYAAVAKEHS